MSIKNVVILQHNGGRLANQLWLLVSVYAYCLDRGYGLQNPSFFEYGAYFSPRVAGGTVTSIFYTLYYWLRRLCKPLGLEAVLRFCFRKMYTVSAQLRSSFLPGTIVRSSSGGALPSAVRYLSPTSPADQAFTGFEQGQSSRLYVMGWLFRNPVGLERYRKEIEEYIQPRKELWEKAGQYIAAQRTAYKHVIGVHIRQGDYKTQYQNGDLYIPIETAVQAMQEFLVQYNLSAAETCFIICSDGVVDMKKVAWLHVVVSGHDEIVDLCILAETDALLGSNSTFGAFAAYYANKPLIVMTKTGVDWEYYEGRTTFFNNKYLTTVHF